MIFGAELVALVAKAGVPLIAQRKLNPVLGDRSDRSPANLRSGRDVDFLPDFSPGREQGEPACSPVRAALFSAYFIGDPATACQWQFSVLGSQ